MNDEVDVQLIDIKREDVWINKTLLNKDINNVIQIFKNFIEKDNKLMSINVDMNKCLTDYLKYEC